LLKKESWKEEGEAVKTYQYYKTIRENKQF